jgi:nitroreductase
MQDPPVTDFVDARAEALEAAADRARLAPSVFNTQPWTLVLAGDRLALRADRDRQLTALDPLGRDLVLSVGAALLNARAAIAGRGWVAEVRRLPDPDDPDLLAEVRPVAGRPDGELAAVDRLIPRRHTNRRRFDRAPLPDHVLDRLSRITAEEGAMLVPLSSGEDRRLAAQLTQQADRLQNGDPAYRAELRYWTTRPPAVGDGVPADVVPHADGGPRDEFPLRDFDTTGAGRLASDTSSDSTQTILVIATATDVPDAWLRAGEAMERVLLELTGLGWAAGPVMQALQVPATRARVRSALTGGMHPQSLLRVGHAAPTPSVPRRRREEVIKGSRRAGGLHLRHQPTRQGRPPAEPATPPRRPVSDGRGGTTWR